VDRYCRRFVWRTRRRDMNGAYCGCAYCPAALTVPVVDAVREESLTSRCFNVNLIGRTTADCMHRTCGMWVLRVGGVEPLRAGELYFYPPTGTGDLISDGRGLV
jgi:hypothetical protein